MPEPLVVQVMREHKKAILAQEDAKMDVMARQWLKIERRLQSELDALALEVARMKEEGKAIERAMVMRMERTQRLLFQIRAETGSYAAWAESYISDYQAILAEQGLNHAQDAIMTVLKEWQVSAGWDRLNVEAVESMIGLAGDRSPLSYWLRDVHPAAADGVLDALLDGVAKGIHPTKIAIDMANGLGLGLQRAMNTARTESLRAYRNATLMQYEASNVVMGYKRISARDSRVCAGCLFTDGIVTQDLTQFEEHNQGRCSMVPVVIGVPEPMWQSPIEWFEGQSATTQESILGTGRFDAWKNGAALQDMVKRVDDPTWGGAFVPTPVGELNQ